VLLALAIAGWMIGRGLEAALVISDLAAGAGDSLFKRLTPPPARRPVVFAGHGGDLYLPAQGARGAMVLVPGAAREGKDDPRLIAFAHTLARARFAVLVPDIASLRALEVSAADAGVLADGVRWLAAEHGGGAVGIAAISYAAGPALLAALGEARVDMVVAVGGYHDLVRVLTFFTTGFVDGVPRQPNAYGKWVFVASNAGRLYDSADREVLRMIAALKMADPETPVDALAARLGPEGQAVMRLLDNRDPARVPALISALPPQVRGEIEALDLARRDLSKLRAKLFLIHGKDDRIVPAGESVSLAAAVPHAELALLDHLAHADLGPGSVIDFYALWRIVDDLLGERDRMAKGLGRG
jgi:pimeloyl-ACP methyl ester carboxylesterase